MNTDKTSLDAQSQPSCLGAVSRSYFHEISQEEVDKLIADKRGVGYVMENYKQPDWCNYPEALSMTMGCWSLCDLKKDGLRTKISKDFCKSCDCFGNCGNAPAACRSVAINSTNDQIKHLTATDGKPPVI